MCESSRGPEKNAGPGKISTGLSSKMIASGVCAEIAETGTDRMNSGHGRLQGILAITGLWSRAYQSSHLDDGFHPGNGHRVDADIAIGRELALHRMNGAWLGQFTIILP